MAIEYLGLSAINGPMVVLEGVSGAAYDEIVEMTVDGNKRKLGRIIEVYEDKAVIQVFEGTEGMGLKNVHTRLTGHPMELGVSTEMLGRTMNGIGEPIDGLGEILPERMLDVNGKPLNPVTREYPRNYIRTGISAIDGLMTLIRGQKLPIFSGNGLPHDQLAAQIVHFLSLEEATSSIALVICMVLSTLLMRSLMSFIEAPAIPNPLLYSLRKKILGILFQSSAKLLFGFLLKFARRANGLQNIRVLGVKAGI